MKIMKLLIIASTALILTACANKYGAAYIVTEPSGVEVVNLDDGTIIGVTPLKQVWQDEGNRKLVNLQLQREGYLQKATSFWLSLDSSSKYGAVNDPQLVEIKMTHKDGSVPETNNQSGDQLNAIQ